LARRGDLLGRRERARDERIDKLAIILGKLADRQPDLIGGRAFGHERGRKAQLVKWVGIVERANRHLVRRHCWSGSGYDTMIFSGESGARQHEKLCQIPHPIGADLAPAFAVLAVSVQEIGPPTG
jgi:hypothetical protein